MPDINGFDAETKDYFYSLPIFVQESIVQSDAPISCKQDLIECANNLMHKNYCGDL